MSKAKDYRHKAKRMSLKIAEDTHEKLTKLAQASKIPAKEIIGFLVDLCAKHGFLKEGWEDRLKASLKDVDKASFRSLDNACKALAWTNKDGFVCCIKAPAQRTLGDGELEDQQAVCDACKRLADIMTRLQLYEEQAKTGTTVSLPQCKNGGQLLEDGESLYCPYEGQAIKPSRCKSWDPNAKSRTRCKYFWESKIKFMGLIRDVGDQR